MKAVLLIGLLVTSHLFVGCVGQRQHAQTTLQLDSVRSRLDKLQRALSEQTDAINALKTQTTAAATSGHSDGPHVEEVNRLSGALQATNAEFAVVRAERDAVVASLQSERRLRSEMEEQIRLLQAERDEVQRVAT